LTSLHKAASFLAKKASRLALAIVPLAAVAVATVPAKADSFAFTTSSCVVVASGGSGTCGVEIVNPVGGDPAGNWLALFGTGVVSGSSVFSDFSSSSSSGFLDFSSSGSATGSISAGANIPVSWLFDIDSSSQSCLCITNTSIYSQSDLVSWTVSFDIQTTDGTHPVVPFFSMSGSGTPGSIVSGTGIIQVVTAGSPFQWDLSLNTSSPAAYGITIPGGATLDLNANVSPEPSTLFLMAGAVGVLYLKRRKHKPSGA
jgi:hypothetical protein